LKKEKEKENSPSIAVHKLSISSLPNKTKELLEAVEFIY